MKYLLTLFLSSLLFLSNLIEPSYSKSTVYIFNDIGGSLGQYIRQTEDYLNRDVSIKFTGVCASGCTLFLAAKDKCAGPDTMFAFHRAYGGTNSQNNYATLVMASYWPQWVFDWLNKRGGISDTVQWMPYSYIRLHMKECK